MKKKKLLLSGQRHLVLLSLGRNGDSHVRQKVPFTQVAQY